jgi:hypothetical protein
VEVNSVVPGHDAISGAFCCLINKTLRGSRSSSERKAPRHFAQKYCWKFRRSFAVDVLREVVGKEWRCRSRSVLTPHQVMQRNIAVIRRNSQREGYPREMQCELRRNITKRACSCGWYLPGWVLHAARSHSLCSHQMTRSLTTMLNSR